jgi:hypothetical protein
MNSQRHSPHSQTHRCENCDGPLRTQRELRDGFCSHWKCRGPCLQRQAIKAKETQARRREARDKTADDMRSALSEQYPDEMESVEDGVFMVVPYNTRELVTQPASRIEEFRQHLEITMDKAQNELEGGEADHIRQSFADRSDGESDLVSLPVLNACQTCRGLCCFQGAASHGFLTNKFFAWRLINEPESSPQSIIDDYLSRIPETAFEDSCVYHTETGCALPRGTRSSTCNEFLCTGIKDSVDQSSDWDAAASAVAATDNGTCHTLGILKTDGTRFSA